MKSKFSACALFAILCLAVTACKPDEPTLNIVAGSETEALSPLLREFSESHHIPVSVSYSGSIDIMNQLDSPEVSSVNAVWPAQSLWLHLGAGKNSIRDERSIMRTPIIFGIKKSVATKLGWVGKPVKMADILNAIQTQHLRLAMTSGTQSNSGAQMLLATLHSSAGHEGALTSADLSNQAVRDKTSILLHSIARSSGSSGWLKNWYVTHSGEVDGMINYEAMVIAANAGQNVADPLYAIYPSDALPVADHALAFVDHPGAMNNEVLHKDFMELQAWLLEPAQQKRIAALGWRTGTVGLQMTDADPAVFRADYGLEPSRNISPTPIPASSVILDALNLYQSGDIRKPSATVILLDKSGSMAGAGISAAKRGLLTIIDPEQAKRVLLQAGPKDMMAVIPFDAGETLEPIIVNGQNPSQVSSAVNGVNQIEADGGTDFYPEINRAIDMLQPYRDRGYLVSIILMTDGLSDTDGMDALMERIRQTPGEKRIPIFSILYGDADRSQLQVLADETGARIFDGRRDLVHAFRDARGYN